MNTDQLEERIGRLHEQIANGLRYVDGHAGDEIAEAAAIDQLRARRGQAGIDRYWLARSTPGGPRDRRPPGTGRGEEAR